MRICTIVAKNYLAHARVLAESFREHNREGSCSVLVIDDVDGYIDQSAEPFEILTPADVGINDFELMAGIYDVVELSTAVKPSLLRWLLGRDEHVAYLDPDIEVFGDLDELDELIGRHGLVLTPHNTEPLPEDGRRPSQTDILLAGAYNLGFIGIGRGEDAEQLLDWWAQRLSRDCRSAPDQGLFVDQRWVDLVPGIVSDHCILRDPGFNLAYWNLPGRRLERRNGAYLVNGQPLRFFHYSGYDPDRPRTLSRHQDRLRLSEEPVLRELCDHYAARLRESGYEEVRRWPYTLDRMADGQRLDESARSLYRSAVEQGAVRRSIFSTEGAADFRRWQRGPAAGWGVNVIGYLRSEMGVGEAARQLVSALLSAEVPVRTVPISSPYHREQHAYQPGSSENDLPVNLVCVNADALPGVAGDEGIRRLLRAHYSIGIWWWEVSSFPARLNPSFDLLDEVWVGSEHVAGALRSVAPIPVHKIVLPVVPPPPPSVDRRSLGLPEGFLFLFVFDYRAVPRRKNALGLVDAFRSAFPQPSEAQLVIKSVNHDAYPEEHAALREAVADRPDVTLLDVYVSSGDKDAMIASCDCYVSLHRSEGFGLTLAEAMYYGRPTIATGYSGNLEFMTAENSYLADYELVPIGEGFEPYPPDGVWAEPDGGQASRLMRRVFENRSEAAERGERAASDIRRLHSAEAAGRDMQRRLHGLRTVTRRSRLVALEDDQPASVAAREARNKVIVGPRDKARTRFGGPIRWLMLRLMKPYTVHQSDVDLMLVNAVDQLNVALRDLEPARMVADGWRAIPESGDLELSSFEHPVAGRVTGYSEAQGRPAGGESGWTAELAAPERLVAERRRPYLGLLEGHAPVLDAGCGRGELLDLLRARRAEYTGVEPDPALAEEARAKGHDAAQGGINAHLEGLEDGSLGAIFSARALRMPIGELTSFMTLARRKLAAAALLVLESPNPHSAEALKLALTEPDGAAPLLPEVALAICRMARFPEAFVFHPQGSGDGERDRYTAPTYAVVATMPRGADADGGGPPTPNARR